LRDIVARASVAGSATTCHVDCGAALTAPVLIRHARKKASAATRCDFISVEFLFVSIKIACHAGTEQLTGQRIGVAAAECRTIARHVGAPRTAARATPIAADRKLRRAVNGCGAKPT